MTFMLVILIGAAAFAVDFGRMYLYRAQLQNASDAAALAGAWRILQKDPTSATDSAINYAGRHNVGITAIASPCASPPSIPCLSPADVIPGTWTPGGGFVPDMTYTWDAAKTAVQVTTRYQADYGFGRIFGIQNHTVTAMAQAVMGYVGITTCVRPIALPYQMLLNQIYGYDASGNPVMDVNHPLSEWDVQQLRDAGADKAVFLKIGSESVQGNFYIVNLGPYAHEDQVPLSPSPNFGGLNVFADRFGGDCSNSPWAIGPGDWLQGKTGNADGPTQEGFGELCGVPITGAPGDYTCGAPVEDRTIKVAMWAVENDAVCSPRCFQVKYVGVFVVIKYVKTSTSDDGVVGYFTGIPTSGSLTNIPTPILKIGLVK